MKDRAFQPKRAASTDEESSVPSIDQRVTQNCTPIGINNFAILFRSLPDLSPPLRIDKTKRIRGKIPGYGIDTLLERVEFVGITENLLVDSHNFYSNDKTSPLLAEQLSLKLDLLRFKLARIKNSDFVSYTAVRLASMNWTSSSHEYFHET